MPTISRLMLLVLIGYVGYALLMALFQRHLMYPGRSLAPPVIASGVAAGAEHLWIITSFGKLEGRLVTDTVPGRQPVVIVFHGNNELIDELSPELERLQRVGCALLLVEYPGYGRSSGRPHERSLKESALAAYDQLIQRAEIDPRRVAAFGISLGSGPAVALASERPLQALLLAAPPASLRPFAHQRLLPAFLLHDTFDNAEIITSFAGPTLVLHGAQDEIMPLSHGRKVAAAARHGKLVTLDAGHNDLLARPQFWQAVVQFLRESGIVEPPAAPARKEGR